MLSSPVKNDYRVIKTIHTLSQLFDVHLFYVGGDAQKDQSLFNGRVSLFSVGYRSSRWQKILRHSFFCFEFSFLIPAVLRQKVPYAYVWANDLPTLYPATDIARRLGSRVIYDSHEIYVETINQFFSRKPRGVKKWVFAGLIALMRAHGTFLEKRLVPKLYAFVTVNSSLLAYFGRRYRLPQKQLVLMNLPKMDTGIPQKMDFRARFGWSSDDRVLIYQGVLNEGRGLTLLIDALPLVPQTVKWVVLGNGPLKPVLEDAVNQAGLSQRVKFIDAVPLEQLAYYTRGADAGLNLLEDFNLSKKLASPNKLFEYIHAGIPVIASDTAENRLVFDKYPIGWLTANDRHSLAKTISAWHELPLPDIKALCTQARAEYNWENQETKLLSIFNP